jgi:hypothetical protein
VRPIGARQMTSRFWCGCVGVAVERQDGRYSPRQTVWERVLTQTGGTGCQLPVLLWLTLADLSAPPVAEDILSVTGEGYVAFYAFFDDKIFRLLNSFLLERGTRNQYSDLTIPTDIVERAAAASGESVYGSAQILGA